MIREPALIIFGKMLFPQISENEFTHEIKRDGITSFMHFMVALLETLDCLPFSWCWLQLVTSEWLMLFVQLSGAPRLTCSGEVPFKSATTNTSSHCEAHCQLFAHPIEVERNKDQGSEGMSYPQFQIKSRYFNQQVDDTIYKMHCPFISANGIPNECFKV